MNILYPETISAQLTAITDEIRELLHGECPKYDEIIETIYIATYEQIKEQKKYWAKIMADAFAFTGDDFYNNEFIRLIVVHEANCNAANLNNEELKAIILHELGHFLNNPELEVEPTTLHCFKNNIRYNKEECDRIVNLNKTKKEVYADAYAKQHGYTVHTEEGFIKYNALFQNNVGFYEERVAALNNNIQYVGTIKPIDRQGF